MHDGLTDIYNRLTKRYGPRDWWPADSRFEVMVGAVLVQNTAWSNAEKGIRALSEAGLLSAEALRNAEQADIAQLIYSSGYYNMKARKLKALVEWLGERDDDIEALMAEDPVSLRKELLGIHGIGDETADDILLYALDMPVFVVAITTLGDSSSGSASPPRRGHTLSTSVYSRRAYRRTSPSSTSTTP